MPRPIEAVAVNRVAEPAVGGIVVNDRDVSAAGAPRSFDVYADRVELKDPSKGNGLGLSMVYGIAKEAGGSVTFTSPPGQGTTFEMLLPLVEARDSGLGARGEGLGALSCVAAGLRRARPTCSGPGRGAY